MTDLAMGRSGNFEIGRVIERTFGVIGANFPTLGGLALALSSLPQMVMVLASPANAIGTPQYSAVMMLGSFVYVIASFVLQAAVVHASVIDLNGGKPSFGDSLRVGLANFFPVLGISIVLTIAVGFGMVLLIVPGVMMAVAWMVAVPVRVMEKKGVFASIGRSAQLTRGNRWPIFGLLFVFVLIVMLFSVFTGILTVALGGLTGGGASLILRALFGPIVNGLGSMIGASGIAAIYYELRSRKEGVAPEELAAVFD